MAAGAAMKTIDEMFAAIMERDSVMCPHCTAPIDMTDCDRLQGHVTYWGEDEAQPITCYACDADFYLKERVTRHWSVGRTPEEAEEI